MNRTLAFLALTAATLPADPAAAATRNYTVTSFTKVRVVGPYAVTILTNRGPFARATGEAAALDRVRVRVEGTTLVVSVDPNGWGGAPGRSAGPVRIEAGTPGLTSASVDGAGALAVDQLRGLDFGLSLAGSGSATLADVAVDRLRVAVSGSGSVRADGRTGNLTAIVRGSGSLDATGLTARDAVIGAEGPAVVKAAVTGTAKVDAAGLASVTLSGSPGCQLNAAGTATVSGCR